MTKGMEAAGPQVVESVALEQSNVCSQAMNEMKQFIVNGLKVDVIKSPPGGCLPDVGLFDSDSAPPASITKPEAEHTDAARY